MNYSLASARRIGNYWQKIITTQFGAPKAENASQLYSMEQWHEKLKYLDADGRVVGLIRYKGFTETEGGGSDNNGVVADGEFVVLSTDTETQKTVTFKITGLTLNNMVNAINSNCFRLVGKYADYPSNYLISATLNLHKGEENG